MMLHADETIFEVVHQYGPWIYLVLFAIIFIETGLVVVTFFPGDALLFSAGMLAATGDLQLIILLPLLILATLLGHTSNYWIARVIGDRFFRGFNSKSYAGITKARQYYERYGGQAVLWSRFFPFIRSFIPFVSGLSGMHDLDSDLYSGRLLLRTCTLGTGKLRFDLFDNDPICLIIAIGSDSETFLETIPGAKVTRFNWLY